MVGAVSHLYVVFTRSLEDDSLARIDTCIRERTKCRWHPAPHIWIVRGESAQGWLQLFKRVAPKVRRSGNKGDLVIIGLTRPDWECHAANDVIRRSVASWKSNTDRDLLFAVAVGMEQGALTSVGNNLREWSSGWSSAKGGGATAWLLGMEPSRKRVLGNWRDLLVKNAGLGQKSPDYGLFLMGLNGMQGAWATKYKGASYEDYSAWIKGNV